MRWHILWESAVTSTPGLVVVLLLYFSGSISGAITLISLLAILLCAVPATLLAALELKRMGTWIEELPSTEPNRHALSMRFAAIEFIARPVLALVKRVRSAEQSSSQREAMIEQLVDALPDPIMLVDEETKVLLSNAAAQKSFPDLNQDVSLPRLIRDPDFLVALTAAIEADAPTSLSFRPISDRQTEFSANIEPIRLPGGSSGALVALREQSEQLMIERIRSDFVANASHEIKTPLASLQGFIETLRGPAQNDPETRNSFLSTMADETTRLTRLVNDLLSLSHIELSATSAPDTPCDIDLVIDVVMDRLASVAASYNVQLCRTGSQDLPTIPGDEDQIHQLLVNLIDNAIKYGGADKRVTIEAGLMLEAPIESGALAHSPVVYVAIKDEGDGIAPEQIPRLTERFYRVDKARSQRVGGTGLGLAIVKHIVRRHRGYLDVRSELGVGSCFLVFLPTSPDTNQSLVA